VGLSFFIDPILLFIIGWTFFHKERKWRLDNKTLVALGYVASAVFIGFSSLLYFDLIPWPIVKGSVFMFHSNLTGIYKENVHIGWVILMFILYPFWILLGYLIGYRNEFGAFKLKRITFSEVKSKKEILESKVIVCRNKSPRELTREAIEGLGGIGEFVTAANRVLIKPNICGGNSVRKGTYTSVEIVDELVKMIRDEGAHPVVADADMIWTKFEPIAKAEGWTDWAERENVRLINLSDTKKYLFDFGVGSKIIETPVSRELVEADVIISVPVMKTHLLTSVTIGMKNMYGTFTEENKAKYHRYGIEDVVYEVNRAFRPNLTIIDGTIGGEGYGPLSCDPVGFETIVASNDVVAADAVACRLMGYDPFEIDHIKKAHETGLGNANITLEDLEYPPNPKDGNWKKPDDRVSTFYEQLIEHLLLVPGVGNLFDLGADLILRDFSRWPFFRDITPEVEEFLDDFLSVLFSRGNRKKGWDEGKKEEFLSRIKNDMDEND